MAWCARKTRAQPETARVEFLLCLADQFLHVRVIDREHAICLASFQSGEARDSPDTVVASCYWARR